MLKTRTTSKHEAMTVLKQDHDKVKKLFDRFEKTDSDSECREIVREACAELELKSGGEVLGALHGGPKP